MKANIPSSADPEVTWRRWTPRIGAAATRVTGTLSCLTALLFPALAWAVEPAKESVPGGALMLGAYILIWAIPLAFLWSSHRRLNGLEEDLHALRSMLEKIPLPDANVIDSIAAGPDTPGDSA